jgi:hypothetical protein
MGDGSVSDPRSIRIEETPGGLRIVGTRQALLWIQRLCEEALVRGSAVTTTTQGGEVVVHVRDDA